jgi:hypothetical protein
VFILYTLPCGTEPHGSVIDTQRQNRLRLDTQVAAFRERPLDQGPYTFVWVDALTVKVRDGGTVRKSAPLRGRAHLELVVRRLMRFFLGPPGFPTGLNVLLSLVRFSFRSMISMLPEEYGEYLAEWKWETFIRPFRRLQLLPR